MSEVGNSQINCVPELEGDFFVAALFTVQNCSLRSGILLRPSSIDALGAPILMRRDLNSITNSRDETWSKDETILTI